jgi:hypothetical protein
MIHALHQSTTTILPLVIARPNPQASWRMVRRQYVDLDARQLGQEQNQAGGHLQVFLQLRLIARQSRLASSEKPLGQRFDIFVLHKLPLVFLPL